MAFNQFMHPRNIYRYKPNFEEMAKNYPQFATYITFDNSKSKAYIDFSNISALRSLTQTLLKKDFGLDVEIPDGRLVPTLPMRLNYILWIEDLLQHCAINFRSNITGIDIGTGSCAIFPLLAITLNSDWNFLATEIDSVNLNYANINVNKNNLSHKIKIYSNDSENIFKNFVRDNPNTKFTFLMTNPPFFEDTFNDSFEDSRKNGFVTNFHNKKNNSACSNEAIYQGGELKFIKKIIEESFCTKTLVDIYTVMIGRKITFLELKSLFKEFQRKNQIPHFTYTELCQGNTKRWAIAWTFTTGFNIFNAPKIISSKSKPLVNYLASDMKVCDYDIKSVADYIKHLLINDLKIDDFSTIETRKKIEFDIKSNECNWKNQRKKRREQKFKEMEQQQLESNIQIGSKRCLNEENQGSEKKFKDITDICKSNLTFLLHCELIIKRDKQDIYIKMTTKEMSQNKDTTFQLFQYFKNKLI